MRFTTLLGRVQATLAVMAVALASTAACNNDRLTSLNANPNSPTDAPAGALFTRATATAVGRWLGTAYDLRGTEFVAQHLAEVQFPDEDRYQRLNAASTQAIFETAYSGELEDYRQVIKKGAARSAPGISGPAQVMQAWVFGYLTDSWGDIPYSQALLADSAGGSVTPIYDSQKSVYGGLLSSLGAAAAAMTADKSGITLGGSDPVYNGDEQAWARFANSLKARLALRLINVDPATADAELRAAFGAPAGVLRTNADNAVLKWPGDGVSDNPWAVSFKTRDDHRLSRTLMNILLSNNDPRIPVFAQPTIDQTVATKFQGVSYAGMPNGLAAATANTFFSVASRPGAVFYPGATTYGTFGGNGAKQASYLMTAAEVLFIKAEAAERGVGGLAAGQAAQFYRDAITASLTQWGVTDAAATAAFLAQPAVAYQGGTAGLKQIAVQKWIALYSDGGQAWAEWRRTCQPATIAAGPAAVVNFVPRRFFYSTNEYSINASNVQAAVGRQGPDDFGTRMYWDSKPAASPTCQ